MEGSIDRDDAAAGYLLAEAIHEGDGRGGARRALARGLADRVSAGASVLAGLDRAERVARLQSIALALRPAPVEVEAERLLPRRALALLAPLVSREAGRRWLSGVSAHRPDFRPPSDLLDYLRRVAASKPVSTEERPWPA